MASVRLANVSRRYPGGFHALKDISFEVKDREVVTVLGPSGCGKSTLLRIIAGLDQPSSGEIWIGNRQVNSIPARSRDVAMVFQSYALYPHMSCFENLALNLVLKKTPRSEIDRRVRETARLLEIGELLDKRPRELSGGQRQRVAVGRALIRNPQVFLFDEPLSNLDAMLREKVRHELKSLFARIQATVIYVTHDQVEAMTLADRTIVLDRGVVQQTGSPDILYREPKNLFVASFIGSPAMNRVDRTLHSGDFQIGAQLFSTGLAFSGPVTIGVRPEAIKMSGAISANVALVENLGSRYLIEAQLDDCSLMVLSDEVPSSNTLALDINPGDIHVFDKNTGESLRHNSDGPGGHPQPENASRSSER
jgi:sn-glycerol 3-phosphate transport system ATP-binding protein